MSYILDALKKAERERGKARVPTLATVHEHRNARRNRLWIIAGGILICAAAAAVYFLVSPGQSVRSPEPLRATVESAVKADLSAAPQPAPSAPTAEGIPALVPAGEVARKPVKSGRRPEPLEQEVDVPEESAQPAPPPVPAAKAPEPAPAPAKAAPLKEAAGTMSISILSYSENKAERLVFINGSKYVEGDRVDGIYLVDSITPEGVWLSHSGEQVFLRPGSK
jgi:hypothetical protein